MDHLPYPSEPAHPALKIPALLTSRVSRYDCNGFLNFPTRIGWCREGGDWFDDDDDEEIAARAQAWLLFGLLKEVFGENAQESRFIRDDHDGRQWVTLHDLPDMTKRFTRNYQKRVQLLYRMLGSLLTTFHIEMLRPLSQYLWTACQVQPFVLSPSEVRIALIETQKQVDRLENRFPASEIVNLTGLSIRALVWSIRNAAANDDPAIFKRSLFQLSPSPYLYEILLRRGLCPHEIDTLQKHCSVSTLHYISAFTYDLKMHDKCSREACLAYIVGDGDYITTHTDQGCNCEFSKVDEVLVQQIIRKGEIPVVFVIEESGETRLGVGSASGVVYTAISHAWSGGLGNPNEASLPICQLSLVDKRLRDIDKRRHLKSRRTGLMAYSKRVVWPKADSLDRESVNPRYFWIDTLCIPPWRNGNDNMLRIKAIEQMDRVYAEAEQVVVLDPTLKMSQPYQTSEQLIAALLVSPWMTRCWTYLEARLARRMLVVQNPTLSDPFVLFDKAARNAFLFEWHSLLWNDQDQFRREIAAALWKLRPLIEMPSKKGQLQAFVEAWNELLRRTTSRSSDAIVILALMLNLSLYEVQLQETTELRLLAIFNTLTNLPLSFLLDNASPDYQPNQCCDWLPQSLTSPVDTSYGRLQRVHTAEPGESYFVLKPRREKLMLFKLRRLVTPDDIIWLELGEAEKHQTVSKIRFGPRYCATNASSALPTELIYGITLNQWSKTSAPRHEARGFALKIVKQESDTLNVTFMGAFRCSVTSSTNQAQGPAQPRISIYHAERVERTVEIRLQQDFSSWPSLQYHRLNMRKLMSSRDGPFHAYSVALFSFEVPLAITALAMILIFLPFYLWPRAKGGVSGYSDFWSRQTTAERSIWILCTAAIVVRMLVVSYGDAEMLNNVLMSAEYQKWTQSFTHTVEQHAQHAQPEAGKSLAYIYQYHSWPFAGAIAALSTALLAIGSSIDRPNIFSVAILGAYLLFQVSVRLSVEIFWRTCVSNTFKVKFARYLFDNFFNEKWEDPILTFFMSEHFRWRKKQFPFEPNALTHRSSTLKDAFDDPLYLPEHYERA